MTRRRRPIVSIAGDTRSNGSVSHAGKYSTASAPRNWRRSAARRSASLPVGTASTTGRRAVADASVAPNSARAGSGTATACVRPLVAAATMGSFPRSVVSPARAAVSGMRGIALDARRDPGRGRDPGFDHRPAYLLRLPRRSPVVAVHRGIHAVGEDHLHRVGGLLDGDCHLFARPLAEPAEHVVGALFLRVRLAHAEPHAQERVVVEVLLDRPQAVVPGQATA